jgi:hypothetical protein
VSEQPYYNRSCVRLLTLPSLAVRRSTCDEESGSADLGLGAAAADVRVMAGRGSPRGATGSRPRGPNEGDAVFGDAADVESGDEVDEVVCMSTRIRSFGASEDGLAAPAEGDDWGDTIPFGWIVSPGVFGVLVGGLVDDRRDLMIPGADGGVELKVTLLSSARWSDGG